MSMWKIEEVAKQTGLTKRAIRYYEDFGLISAPERTSGGIRLYSEENVEQIKKILLVKEVLGFSLAEIQEHLSFKAMFEQQRNEVLSSEDREERKLKLQEMLINLKKEQELIDNKIIKMEQFKKELHGFEVRILEAVERLQG